MIRPRVSCASFIRTTPFAVHAALVAATSRFEIESRLLMRALVQLVGGS